MNLTESQQQTILHAMRVSAERFQSDADTMRALASNVAPSGLSEYSRLADQFDKQVRETRELADMIEENGLAFVTLTCSNSLTLAESTPLLSNSDADFQDRD